MTLFSIFKRYRWRILLTLILVLTEAGAMLLLPLVIGIAIDGLLTNSCQGIYWLAVVGLGITISGSLRRLYDTRVYSGIYVDLSSETVKSHTEKSTSTINARVIMLKELVEFLENQMPELLNSVVALVGTVIILYALDFEIFLGCLAVLALMIAVFMATGKLTTTLNHHYNNTLEEQVMVIENCNRKNAVSVHGFMKRLMGWKVKISDLETAVFGIIWLGMVALIVFSVMQAVGTGEAIRAGEVMSVMMYVFNFAEGAGMLPLYFQQFLRLQEISSRLNNV